MGKIGIIDDDGATVEWPRWIWQRYGSDYIDLLRKKAPKKLLFITGASIQEKAREKAPDPEEEVLCDLSCPKRVIELKPT